MSEYINNVSQRKEIIKNVLRQLHEGKSIEEVQAEFSSLASQVSYSEIADIEQMLIQEGTPVEEIQNLCDVHVAFFRAGLDEQIAPETLAGHPVHTLRAENERIGALMDEIDGLLAKESASGNLVLSDQAALSSRLDRLAEIHKHYSREENQLFPYLERYGFYGPSKVMWGLHDQIRAQVKDLRKQLAENPLMKVYEFQAEYKTLADAVREMIYKEEKILLPTSLEKLTERDWIEIRLQEHEIGYFEYTPGNDWGLYLSASQARNAGTARDAGTTHDAGTARDTGQTQTPAPAVEQAAAAPAIGEGLALDTGVLALEQINLMLTHLPVDITYVDENDQVRYFSQTRERIFDRSAAIIGRAVQNCHPPQSVDKVQRILDDFKAGKRSQADFWIQMGPRFILIRYFAMRDQAGAYRGCLEVSQDATWIRSLEGERRLLDD